MQSCQDGQFKYLLNYQDHGIKLYANAALTSKTPQAVAYALVDIFTIIGAPAILQTDNGREFTKIANKQHAIEPIPVRPYRLPLSISALVYTHAFRCYRWERSSRS